MQIINVFIVASHIPLKKNIDYTLGQHPHLKTVHAPVNLPDKLLNSIKESSADVLLYQLDSSVYSEFNRLVNFLNNNPIPTLVVTQNINQYQKEIQAIEQNGIYHFLELPDKAYTANQKQPYLIHKLAKELTNAAYTHLPDRSDFVKDNPSPCLRANIRVETPANTAVRCHEPIIAIGASTGGIVVVENIIRHLSTDMPPIVITQHIPPVFSHSFAHRLNEHYPLSIYEASHNQVLETGCVYIAPGDQHLKIICKNNQYTCQLSQSERVSSHRPSVNVMFDSIVELNSRDAVGIILTGMGNDGVQGLLRLKQTGSFTIAQDKDSSLIWGMPGEAIKMGAVCEIFSPEAIAHFLIRHFH